MIIFLYRTVLSPMQTNLCELLFREALSLDIDVINSKCSQSIIVIAVNFNPLGTNVLCTDIGPLFPVYFD